MPRTRKDWERTATGVGWPDVWNWADSVCGTWGYNVVVKVCQPLSTQRNLLAVVVVELTKLKVSDPQRDSSLKVWRNVPLDTTTVEAVALQLLVEVDAKLERQAWAAESAALANGALL